ncbi:ABC transporter substrate-binding protein [Halostagnicola kamekurae]|uniref:Branched-chain amino acid transport system substrate-binding protein n=1 Tax=Halostagnicola kamekurae TaxID=619731 RepID=A0A1I6TP62_9EURY|nr:ABC transporter substrate-binding protein [Halostagnicola kamekurae]SFS90757.1 branched-chain amino acid transport system substrate-binding protein [Halostagnicola kamekurae]
MSRRDTDTPSKGDSTNDANDRGPTSTLSRRQYLAGTAAAGVGATLAGCTGGSSGLTVGYALPFTGTYAYLGESIVNGFEMYLEQQDGEINGEEVNTVQLDTEADTNRGVEVTRQLLIEEGADAIVGPVSSAVAIAMMDIIETESSAIWLNANAGDYRVTQEGCLDYHFRTSFNDWQTSAPLAEWVYDNVADNVSLSYADYAFGQNSKNFFSEAFQEAGGEVVEEVGIPLGTSDYAPYLGDIEDSGADAIYSFFAGSDAINYVDDLTDLGIHEEMTQTASGFMFSEDTLPSHGSEAAGMYSLLHYSSTIESERNQTFVEAYNELYDASANVYACQGYDSGQAFGAAIEEAGGSDPDDLVSALSGMELESPRGDFQFNPDTHEAIQDMYVLEVVESDGENAVVNEVTDTIESVEGPSWGCSL